MARHDTSKNIKFEINYRIFTWFTRHTDIWFKEQITQTKFSNCKN